MAGEAANSARAADWRDRGESEAEFVRIVAFTDGVMAIAITLLVLNLEVPQVPSGDAGALADGLVDLLPHFFSYALSFAVIGRLWLVHHRFFATLHGFDGRLMVSNLVYLGLIVLVPFSSDMLGTYGDLNVAVMVYAATLGLAALVNLLMIRYALRHDLVRERDRPATEPFAGPGAVLVPGSFIVSIPVALLNPIAAEILWLGAFIGIGHQRRVGYRRGASRSGDPP